TLVYSGAPPSIMQPPTPLARSAPHHPRLPSSYSPASIRSSVAGSDSAAASNIRRQACWLRVVNRLSSDGGISPGRSLRGKLTRSLHYCERGDLAERFNG